MRVLGRWHPVGGSKPHLYREHGRWWVRYEGVDFGGFYRLGPAAAVARRCGR